MRAVELGLDPDDLAARGRHHGRPEWVAAASVLREYDEVTALSAPGAFDPAWILGAAADSLEADPAALDRLRATLGLVVVDDAQELTPAAPAPAAGRRGRRHVDLVLLGDPDSATQTFRGADPRLLVTAWPDAPTLRLTTSHRCGTAVLRGRRARRRPRRGRGRGGAPRRSSRPTTRGRSRCTSCAPPPRRRATWPAACGRAHLLDGMPWSRMAVVVRGGSRTATLRRVLRSAGVPVDCATADLPVRDEPAVRPFLTLLRCALEVVGGADAPRPRRRRRRPRLPGRRCGCRAAAPPAPVVAAPRARRGRGPAQRRAPRRGGARALRPRPARARGGAGAAGEPGPRRGRAAPCATGTGVEAVLWRMWSASGLAGPWRDAALAGGPAGGRADRDLDAVLGLFDAAARFVDRLPGASAADFVDSVLGQDVAGDTLVAAGARGRVGRPRDARRLRRPRVGPRRRRGGAGGRVARPAAARLAARLRRPRRRSDRPGRRRARGACPGAARRDPAVPRRGDTGPGAARRHGGAQRGRAALAVPRRRRPAAARPAVHRRPAADDARRPRRRPAARGGVRRPRGARCGGHHARPACPRGGPRRRSRAVVGAARPHRRPGAPRPAGPRAGLAVGDRRLLAVRPAVGPARERG